jgi:hypothetical protein
MAELKKVPLDSRVLDRPMCIGMETGQQEQLELLALLDKTMISSHGQPPTLWETTEISLSIGYK